MGVHVQTLYRYLRNGGNEIPHKRLASGTIIIFRGPFLAWLEARETL